MTNVLLYFGSFNPVHIGHLAIAHYAVVNNLADQLWFVVSPQNPFKSNDTLAPFEDRFKMVEMAISQYNLSDRVKACDIESRMAIPSYTIDTIRELKKQLPGHTFSIIMGEDNHRELHKWKEYEEVISHQILVYPRTGCQAEEFSDVGQFLTNVPTFNISSSLIRDYILKDIDVSLFLPKSIDLYIKNRGIYGAAR